MADDTTRVPGLQIVFDCRDPDSLASFWAAALGYQKQWTWDPETVLEMRAQGLRDDRSTSAVRWSIPKDSARGSISSGFPSRRR